MDWQKIWCATEVVKIENNRIKIHYTGWPDKFDWIYLPSERIAPAFSYTSGAGGYRKINRAISEEIILRMLHCSHLNVSSGEEVRMAFKRFGFDIQNTINGLRFENRAEYESELMHMLAQGRENCFQVAPYYRFCSQSLQEILRICTFHLQRKKFAKRIIRVV
jgi:hypothetical protein